MRVGIGKVRKERRTFVASIVQVDEVLFVFLRKSGGVNGVSMVLGRDVALTGCQVESRDVVGSVAVLELDGPSTDCESKQLVTKADTHDWELEGFHQSGQVVDGLLAMSWVTRSVGDENTVEVMSDLVDGEIIWEDGDACTTANQTSQDVLLDTAIDDSYVHVTVLGADVEWSLGTNSLDQIDLLGIDKSLVLVGIIFFSDCNPSQ